MRVGRQAADINVATFTCLAVKKPSYVIVISNLTAHTMIQSNSCNKTETFIIIANAIA